MTELSLSIDEVSDITGIGRTKIYAALKNGLLKAHKFGKRTIILREDLNTFLANLESYPLGKANANHDKNNQKHINGASKNA